MNVLFQIVSSRMSIKDCANYYYNFFPNKRHENSIILNFWNLWFKDFCVIWYNIQWIWNKIMSNKKKVICISFLNALNIHIISKVQRCCILLIIEHIQHLIPYMYAGVCVYYMYWTLPSTFKCEWYFVWWVFIISHILGGEKSR